MRWVIWHVRIDRPPLPPPPGYRAWTGPADAGADLPTVAAPEETPEAGTPGPGWVERLRRFLNPPA